MGMPYSLLPTNMWKKIGINAGVILSAFDPAVGTVNKANIIGATTGTVTFNANQTYKDFGEDVNNCPKNTKELMQLDDWDIKLSGTFISADTESSARLMALADISGNKITPRTVIDILNDFGEIWFVFDYGDTHTGQNPGRYVIHMMNTLSTGGFQVQTDDKEKAKWPFEFTAHFSVDAESDVPFEIYVMNDNVSPSIDLNAHVANVTVNDTVTLKATTVPAGATVTWSSSATGKASVSNGVVTGASAGSAIITASITEDGVTYSDTCTVIVSAAT